MSTVYLAHDPHFERDVAIKLLPHELLHHPTFRRRFEREAKIVASLDHPAIVPVYDFGEHDGQPFLVMRFMPGGSLADRIKAGPIPLMEVARIITRLATALDEIHLRGIVHRDLKPSNILFDQRDEPYISDFGTAKMVYGDTKLTETGGAVGTPAYMSPEQIQGESNIDNRSDIYSLGVILFEMLAGKHPYESDTPLGLAVKHIFEPVPHILDTNPDLPVGCQAIISRAMAKNREERFPTVSSMAEALAAEVLLTQNPQLLDRSKSFTGSFYRPYLSHYGQMNRRAVWQKWLLRVGVAIGLALLVGAFVWQWQGTKVVAGGNETTRIAIVSTAVSPTTSIIHTPSPSPSTPISSPIPTTTPTPQPTMT
ncbi:MAG: serine/threonine protein kinase, partial [Chloroflexi bacterium]